MMPDHGLVVLRHRSRERLVCGDRKARAGTPGERSEETLRAAPRKAAHIPLKGMGRPALGHSAVCESQERSPFLSADPFNSLNK